MKRSGSRILTTHVGSLVRPPAVLEILRRKEDGEPFRDDERGILARHVAEGVRMQAECGIDIPSDGEYSKSGFAQYITDRLTGFELRPDLPEIHNNLGCVWRDLGRFERPQFPAGIEALERHVKAPPANHPSRSSPRSFWQNSPRSIRTIMKHSSCLR